MKRKKLMALLMAGTMLMGSTVMAGATGVSTNNVSDNDAGQTITGEGSVDYVDTTVYEVIIPTTSTLGLTVDPQGLTGLQDGQTASASDLSAYAGKVFSDGVAIIANLGSKPVKVGVELALTGQATGVTTEAAVETGTGNNILLYAVPAATSFYNSTNDGTGYTASTKGIVMDGTTAAEVNFVIPAAEYEFKKTGSKVEYVRKESVTPSGTGIKFAGKVNTKADWSDFEVPAQGGQPAKKIGMTAKFTFTHNVTASDVPDSTTGAPAFMMAYDDATVTVAADSTSGGSTSGGSQQTDNYVMTKNNDGSASYTFVNKPTGSLTALTINGTAKPGMITNSTATYSNGVLTINATGVTNQLSSRGTYTIVVTIGGVNKTLTYTVS